MSVYVDDVIVSADCSHKLHAIQNEIYREAQRSRFVLTSTDPQPSVEAFNIRLAHRSMEISLERLNRFRESIASSDSTSRRNGIVSYIASVSEAQAEEIRP